MQAECRKDTEFTPGEIAYRLITLYTCFQMPY